MIKLLDIINEIGFLKDGSFIFDEIESRFEAFLLSGDDSIDYHLLFMHEIFIEMNCGEYWDLLDEEEEEDEIERYGKEWAGYRCTLTLKFIKENYEAEEYDLIANNIEEMMKKVKDKMKKDKFFIQNGIKL